MNTKITTTVRNYWLALAAVYGLTLSVVAMAEWPWPLIMGAAAILIDGTPVAIWAGPLLALATFLDMYLYLHHFGGSYGEPSETAS